MAFKGRFRGDKCVYSHEDCLVRFQGDGGKSKRVTPALSRPGPIFSRIYTSTSRKDKCGKTKEK